MRTFKFYADPGHAWLEVTRQELRAAGIAAEISKFSYADPVSNKVYLEEDADAGIFLRAAGMGSQAERDAAGVSIISKHIDDNIFIRQLPAYEPVRGIDIPLNLMDEADDTPRGVDGFTMKERGL